MSSPLVPSLLRLIIELRVREIEIATHVPKRFRYPHFTKLCWYAAEKYLRDLKAREEFQPRVLESIEALFSTSSPFNWKMEQAFNLQADVLVDGGISRDDGKPELEMIA